MSLLIPSKVKRLLGQIAMVVFDFDGVFTDNFVYVNQDGVESVRCWRSDGLGLQMIKARGMQVSVLSTETNPVVVARCQKLSIPCVQGCGDKGAGLRKLAGEMGLPLSRIAYVGNDINDEDCLKMAGLPIVVRDAHPSVVRLGWYRTRALGGQGAVREVCELLMTSLPKPKDAQT